MSRQQRTSIDDLGEMGYELTEEHLSLAAGGAYTEQRFYNSTRNGTDESVWVNHDESQSDGSVIITGGWGGVKPYR